VDGRQRQDIRTGEDNIGEARAEVLDKARAYRTLCEGRTRTALAFHENEIRKQEARFELAGAALHLLECEEARAERSAGGETRRSD
jgi:hypothetical protein